MSGGLLGRAAALMRERAEKACDAPWTYREVVVPLNPESDDEFTYVRHDVLGAPWDTGKDEPYVAQANGAQDATHIASWHPEVAVAVARLLDAVPSSVCLGHERCDPADCWPSAALAVARIYLGLTPDAAR